MWIIIRRELLANLLSFRFIIIFLLCCTLIVVSAYTARSKYDERVREYSAAVSIHRRELAESERGSTSTIRGYKLDKPPAPLSVIAEGMEGSAGKYAKISILSMPTLEGASRSDPMFAYFGTLDMIYIVRIVLSLVVLVGQV